MAKKIDNLKMLVIIQFFHTLIVICAFSVVVDVFFFNAGGLLMFALLYLIPIFLVEFLLVIKYGNDMLNLLLPILSIFILLLPVILTSLVSSVSPEVVKYSFVSIFSMVTALSLYLLMSNFGRTNKTEF